jgi:hypothetical protein
MRNTHEVEPGMYVPSDGGPPVEVEVPVQANQEEHRRGREYLLEQAALCVPPGATQESVLRALNLMAEGYTKREASARAQISYQHLGMVLNSLRSRVTLPD